MMVHRNAGSARSASSGRSHWRRLIAGALMLAWLPVFAAGQANELVVYSTNIAPFFYTHDDAAHGDAPRPGMGAINELLTLAAREAGRPLDIRALPFKRLQALLDTRPQTLAVMWRLPEFEHSRVWVSKLLTEQLVVLLRNDSVLETSDPAALRQLRIGVVLGGPAEMAVRRLGFTHIETAATAESNVRKLAVGRIDAWVGFRSVANATLHQMGSSMDAVRVGPVLQNMDLYLTCGLHCDEQEVSRWRTAFALLRKAGRQQSLLGRYQLSLSPETHR